MKKELREYLRKIGRKGGKAKSEAKTRAARENGKKNKGGTMKLILILVSTMFLYGCGASMVSTRGKSTSNYAPSNERDSKGGLVKYLNEGAKSVKAGRRESAYKQMYKYCDGPYTITHEGEKSNGAVEMSIPGPAINTAYYAPANYWYIDFACDSK
jgi:hypothetical protein